MDKMRLDMVQKRPRTDTVEDIGDDEELEICVVEQSTQKCKPIPDLPKCEFDVNSIKTYSCKLFSEEEPKIKAILLKRTAPQLIKNIFNTKHHRQIIQHVLQNTIQGIQGIQDIQDIQDIQEKYKLNSKTTGYGYDYDVVLKSWLKLFMLHHLEHHVFARLANGEHGVSIKAIRTIPEGTRVFENMSGQCTLYHPIDITEDEINDGDSDNSIKELLNDFYLQLNGNDVTYPIPAMGPNMIDMSFFLNHASKGNIRIDTAADCDMSSYVSSMEIEKGSTLTINYLEFTKKNDRPDEVDPKKVVNLVNRMPFLASLDPFNNYVVASTNSSGKVKYILKEIYARLSFSHV